MDHFPVTIIQANVNHSARAQDLLLHTMTESGYGLTVVSEPYRIPKHPNWVGNQLGSVAIIKSSNTNTAPLRALAQGRGFVLVAWGDLRIAGVYAPPSWSHVSFEEMLDEIYKEVACDVNREKVLILGDFNAKGSAWGSTTTNARGSTLAEWAASLDLRLLNKGNRSTCVRWQGESIVDLSWASPRLAQQVDSWEVLERIETLSDHLYIAIRLHCPGTHASRLPLGTTCSRRKNDKNSPPGKKWAVKKINSDLLAATACIAAWSTTLPSTGSLEEEAGKIVRILTDICNTAMPKQKPFPKKGTYWWTQEIEAMRLHCTKMRRRFQRARRRRHRYPETEEVLYREYRESVVRLQREIKEAKTKAWEELCQTLDQDPWGRPYRIVLGKLNGNSQPATESLDSATLTGVLNALFPGTEECATHVRTRLGSTIPPITDTEMASAISRMTRKLTAPGPDGVPGKALALALTEIGPLVRNYLNRCLQAGYFPKRWKNAKLVLIQKPGRKDPFSPSSYRPICLLDEVGKLFERIIADRINSQLPMSGHDLDDQQFGFRKGRSTIEAIDNVLGYTRSAIEQGGLALAVSLDIVNAFNSLPWEKILIAIDRHGLPHYIKKIIRSYLSERSITYNTSLGHTLSRQITRGVPQGSVLGPILWNLGFNSVLETPLPSGVQLFCYADDTLVIATGRQWTRTARLTEVAVAAIATRIRKLDLKIAAHKTEALWIHGLPKSKKPPRTWLTIQNERVQVKEELKYLGLTLDGRLTFDKHFDRLIPKVEGVAASLGRLLPNIGGPNDRVRRLYAGIINSMMLYGSPCWSLFITEHAKKIMRRLQRRMAIRIIRGYRTISYDAAITIAGLIPYDMIANTDRATFLYVRNLRASGYEIPRTEANKLRRQALAGALEQRRTQIAASGSANKQGVREILKVWDTWGEKGVSSLTYRITQVLSGHGCLGEYLHKIGAEVHPGCHECGATIDSVKHAVENCPRFGPQRLTLETILEQPVTTQAITNALVGNDNQKSAASSFCDQIIKIKEEGERGRERGTLQRRARRERRVRTRRGRPDTTT